MGASGTGKSTLMNILGALDRPSGGRYLLNGVDVAALDDDALSELRNRQIGFVFQQFHLLARANVLRNVHIVSQFLGEALIVTLVGGVLGVVVGIVAALVLSDLATVTVMPVVVGLVSCCAVALVFGIYPARKAAAVDPIVSLRNA